MERPEPLDRPGGPQADEPTRRGAWAWVNTGAALAAVRRRELAALTDADARRAIADLLALLEDLPPKESDTGLVEQQRLYARLRSA